jgi:hypothetical protein
MEKAIQPGVTTEFANVTPTNGDLPQSLSSVETPVVGLGALHRDHSSDEESEPDVTRTEQGSTPEVTNAVVTEPTPEKKAFPRTTFVL